MSPLDDKHGYRVKVALEVGGLAMIALGVAWVMPLILAHGRYLGRVFLIVLGAVTLDFDKKKPHS